jgi:hypothetical protein
MMILRRATAVVAFCLLVVALLAMTDQPGALAQQSAPEPGSIVKIPLVAGDSLQVRFTEPFEAGDLAKGETPKAEVAADKVISGVVMVTAGTPVTFAVVPDAVEDNGRAGKPGKFELVFESVEAVDGQSVPLTGTLARKGSGRGIIVKIFTLFLIKGEDPGVEPEEVFWAEIAENTYIYAEQP